MHHARIAAFLLAAAAPLFAEIHVLTATPRGIAPNTYALVTLHARDPLFTETPSSVRFGNVPATGVTVIDPYTLSVVAPPQEASYVWIVVRVGTLDFATVDWFGYGIGERVLIPIAGDAIPGAQGTRWSTEIQVHNDSDHAVPLDLEYCDFIGRFSPCGTPVTRVPAHATVTLTGRGSADYPYAQFFPPVQDVDSLHFSVHVRELSTNGAVIEIPAVRQRDLRTGRVILPGISTSDRYRTTLRIFSGSIHISMWIVDSATGAVLASRTIDRMFPTDSDTFSLVTLQDLFTTLRDHARVDVVIDTGDYDLYWALLTLTDNATQQVTTFTPQ